MKSNTPLTRLLFTGVFLALEPTVAVSQRPQSQSSPSPTVTTAVDGIGLSDNHGLAQEEDFYTAMIRDKRFAEDRPEGLIKLDVMVTEATGNPVAGLAASDFHLLENGREQKILSFEGFTGRGAGPEPPVKVIVLIDALQVSAELVRDERDGVISYLRKNGGRLAHPTSVFQLSETGLWAVANLSTDGNALARGLEHSESTLVRRNTLGPRTVGLAPSIDFALMALGQIATEERRQPGRKLLLWVGPNGSRSEELKIRPSLYATICWFSTLLREAQLTLYSLSAGESESSAQSYNAYIAGVASPHGASSMNLDRSVLAIQSGGLVLDSSEIEDEIGKCVREAGPFYRISFDPFAAEHPDEYHDLKLEVDDRRLNAHTNTGFYDQPYYSADQIPPLKRMSLEELQRIVDLDESDAAKANQLKGVELTQRLSEGRLATLFTIVHGKRTRQQLRILADASSFLDPPTDEIPAAPPPSPDEQQHMVSMTATYLTSAIHKLPDFLARRVITRYQETPMFLESGVKYQPLHQTAISTTTVHYLHGQEDADAEGHSLRLGNLDLITYGVFDIALQNVLDALNANGRFTWIRWEREIAGRAAVFRSTVPVDQSLSRAMMCCLPDGDGAQTYQRYASYQMEIAIAPDSGAILRLSFQFDLKSTSPLSRSDTMIEYGLVQIGGRTYDCPLRSVSITRVRSVRVLRWWDESFRTYGPYTILLNDSSFDQYNIFRSESRVLTGFTPAEK